MSVETLLTGVHFLMAGSFLINNKKVDHDGGSAAESPSFEMDFSKDKLTFHKAAVDIRTSESCRVRYDDLNDVDICSPIFNHRRAVVLVMSQTGRQLCDVLLDQTILPGVGNIIKNEALFDSGVKPDSKVEELSEEHVIHLVKMTRDFSMIFLKCRRQGTNLGKFLKIYNKGKCSQCDGKVVRCRQGDDSARMTFFCGNCQDNNLVMKTKRTLPTKNSLLGWVQPGQAPSTPEQEWSCAACTFINSDSKMNCGMCFTAKPCTQGVSVTSLTSLNLTPKMSDITSPKTSTTVLAAPPTGASLAGKIKSGQSSGFGHPQKRKSTDTPRQEIPPKQRKTDQETHVSSKDDSKIPLCPGHKKKCTLREVFKNGDNRGRWFFSCPLRGPQKCKHFQWADELFPFCEAHGKRCTLRTVLKQGPNNGRQFFVCAVSKSKVKCNTFQWASGFET
ncbi:endonuclease 8-like 3 isoform X3 [Argopecten irradians]|uniref:endonuclease 8-like 3 isoform X3 n=1 Tax=Argopecten irradians TaxID=31199 RepID=UPI003711B1D3